MRSASLRRFALRIRVLTVVGVAAFVLLAARAGYLTLVDTRGRDRAPRQTDRSLRVAPHRGLIVDRHGAELAVSLESPSVYASPASIENPEATARKLASALGMTVRAVRGRIDRASRFSFVTRWVSQERAERVRGLALPGVGVIDEPRRVYPHHALAAQAVGFANIDGEGVRGIEQQEDEWLQGTPLRIPVERDNRGRLLYPAGVNRARASGGDVRLTLDAVLQAEAERALDEAVQRSGARAGIVVSLDPRTSEILALAERPGFDPNQFRRVPYPTTRARSLLDLFEPGSTFKIFLIAAALDAGVIEPGQEIDCGEGKFRVPGKIIRDRRAFGLLDPEGVLRVSSNVGATKIAFSLGAEAHHAALQRFGFGRSTGSGFPDESAGLLRTWRDWKPVDHATIAYGQGVSVTPLQLAAATAALANGGVWTAPRLVSARRLPGGQWKSVKARSSRRVVSASTASRVLKMMRSVVSTEGTGRRAGLRGVAVAGKTGTSQKLDAKTGRYFADRYLAWFVGVVPADDPKLVVVVMLDEPADAQGGGGVAAPLFAQVASAQLRSAGIATAPEPLPVKIARRSSPIRSPKQRQVVTVAASPPPPKAPSKSTQDLMAARIPQRPELGSAKPRVLVPDFQGLTREEVTQVTADGALRLELRGRGRAVAQDPDPGTILAARSRVRVRFAPWGG